MYCPVCGTQNVGGGKFCAGCGSLLVSETSVQTNSFYAQPATAYKSDKTSSKKLIGLAVGLLFLAMLVDLVTYLIAYTSIWKIDITPLFLILELSGIASAVLLMVYAFGFYKNGRGKVLFALGHIVYALYYLMIIIDGASYLFDDVEYYIPLLLSYFAIIVFCVLMAVFTFVGLNNPKIAKIVCISFFISFLTLHFVFDNAIFPQFMLAGTLLLSTEATKKS